MRVAQAYVREDRNIRGFHDVNRRYLTDRLGAQRLIAIYFPFVLFVADIGAVIVLATGNHLVRTGAVTTGVVIAFLLYLDQFFAPIQQLSQVLDTWQQAAASTSKIEELFAIPSGTPAPGRPGRPRSPGRRDPVRRRPLPLPQHRRRRGARRHRPDRRPGRDGGAGRRDGRRQVDHRQAGQPLLRPDGRARARRRDRPARHRPRRVPPPDRHRPAGGVPLHRHPSRQHRLRPSRRHRRRGRGGGACRRCPRLRGRADRRLPGPGERARPVALGRPAPAHRPGPGPPGRPGHPAARRGHLTARPGQRGPRATGDGGGGRGPHDAAGRSPPAHGPARRSHRGHRPRSHRRAGHPRRPAGATGAATPTCGRPSPRPPPPPATPPSSDTSSPGPRLNSPRRTRAP